MTRDLIDAAREVLHAWESDDLKIQNPYYAVTLEKIERLRNAIRVAESDWAVFHSPRSQPLGHHPV